jgi:hypothetical protein
MRLRRLRHRAIVVASLLALLLAGCGKRPVETACRDFVRAVNDSNEARALMPSRGSPGGGPEGPTSL